MFTSPGPGNPERVRNGGNPIFDAVLFDRDGTLVVDVPYNGDPDAVRAVPGARRALDRLRAAGLRVGVISNQSGLARGRFTEADLARVQHRIEQLLGPFDTWQICPHDETAGCRCRKPEPGLVYAAAAALGTTPERCAVVGDIGRDMVAAGAAGAFGVLVPTRVTRAEEIAAAPAVAGDLTGAVDLILRRQRLITPNGGGRRPGCVLVARTDAAGDVLLAGPAIRAVAAGAERVVLLCGPRGRAAARLLPGVDEIIEWPLPWIDPRPDAPDPAEMHELVERLAAVGADEAIIFTSFHQSPLPLALLLRMARVQRVCAISDDYPGSLLDLRHRVPMGLPEAERALSLAVAAGYRAPDDLALRLRDDMVADGAARLAMDGLGKPGYVVMHPGASVPARACPPERCAEMVDALAADGHRVVVTGGPTERSLTAAVARDVALDLGGRTDLPQLAGLISRAGVVVAGNTGPAHLAAAVGTPVVSLFAPTVPFGQWGPYRVPWVRLGPAAEACRNTRATTCPVPGHPCLTGITPQSVVAAVRLLRRRPASEWAAAIVPTVPGAAR
jgi:HAD superfamily hydrolase (TIGR01662 family)